MLYSIREVTKNGEFIKNYIFIYSRGWKHQPRVNALASPEDLPNRSKGFVAMSMFRDIKQMYVSMRIRYKSV